MEDDRGPIDRLLGGGGDDADGDDGGDDADGDEWRFSVAEVGPDADEGEPSTGREPLEPEPVSPEHAAFVIAGAALTLLVVLGAVYL